ncbi:MAG: hypothetical protein HZB38_11265 [Planctomycetes bacterium]|nr:hypothetical protein [Planctomycetota bacterium]
MIAATGTITINGSIVVSGGSGVGYGGIYWAGGGSGGAIRLLAQAVAGSGGLSAGSGGGVPGGVGRIAINANTVSYTGSATPVPLMFAPIVGDPIIWPPSTAPNIAVTSLQFGANVVSVPSDPRANWGFPTDASVDSVDPITLNIEATNVPLDWIVTVRIVPKDGDSFTVTAPPLSGTLEFSTTSITALTLPRGFGAVQARAARPTP